MKLIDAEKAVEMIAGIKPGDGNGPNWQFGFNVALEVAQGAIAALPDESGVVVAEGRFDRRPHQGRVVIDGKPCFDVTESVAAELAGQHVELIVRKVGA